MHDNYMEILKAKQYKPYFISNSGRLVNHVEELKGADFYIGAWLKALQDINVYSAPGSSVLKAVFKPGDVIGRVFSYTLRNGKVWWQIDTPLGVHLGFVEHAKGRFDPKSALDSSSGKEHDEKLQVLKKVVEDDPLAKVGDALGNVVTGAGDIVSGAGKTLSSLGKNLNWIIGAAILLVIVIAFSHMKKLGSL